MVRFAARVVSRSRRCLRVQREGWVAIGGEQDGVGRNADAPASDADDEVEQSARVAAGEQDREPRDHHAHERSDTEEHEDYVVRDRQEPLHERQPAVQIAPGVGIMDG